MTQRYSQLKNEIHHLEQELKDATPIYQEVLKEKLKALYQELKPLEAEAKVERAKALASRAVAHGIKVTVSMEPHESETAFARQLREALVGRR